MSSLRNLRCLEQSVDQPGNLVLLEKEDAMALARGGESGSEQ